MGTMQCTALCGNCVRTAVLSSKTYILTIAQSRQLMYRTHVKHNMHLGPLVEVDELHRCIQQGYVNHVGDNANGRTLRILDCSFKAPASKPDHVEFQKHWYAQWDKLMERESEHKGAYQQSKIPGALFVDIGAATYPSETENYAMYPAELFQQYVQQLGINKDDHLVCYDRSPSGGMVFAARIFWIFKAFGHDSVSVLNGGFHAWMKSEQKVTSGSVTAKKGNWIANHRPNHIITFEQLTTKDFDGKDMLNKAKNFNLVDTRPTGQYTGRDKTGFGPTVTGVHMPGTINWPAKGVLAEDGRLKSKEQLQQYLESSCIKPQLPIITYCNTGMNASLAAFGLHLVLPNPDLRIYFGSLKEIEKKDPSRISGVPIENTE